MKYITSCTKIALLLLLITIKVQAQDNNIYRATNAEMLRVNGNTRTENELKGVIIALPVSSGLLNVKLNIPCNSFNYKPADTDLFSSPALLFSLQVNINPLQVTENITSAKTFATTGLLTLNNITKAVRVEYMPLPSGSELDGKFNLSLLIQFYPGDFSLDEPHSNAEFIIKINDTPVNRI